MVRLEEYRDLVYATVKDITWIGTEISDDEHFINIKIAFGSRCAIIPIKIEDIMKNQLSTKNFVDLIKLPLEAILKRVQE